MGVLEDAIREHLELKRQHGASEQELTQEEEEALGPARRDVAGAEAAEAEIADELPAGEPVEAAAEPVDEVAAGGAEEAIPAEDALAAETGQPFDHGEPPAVADEPATELAPESSDVTPPEFMPAEAAPAEPAAAESAPAKPAPAEPAPAEPAPEDVRFDEEEPGVAPPMPTPADEPESGTASAEGEEQAEEDVLEETPEFLQETPEHDRLWFEQKPPRDFDFD